MLLCKASALWNRWIYFSLYANIENRFKHKSIHEHICNKTHTKKTRINMRNKERFWLKQRWQQEPSSRRPHIKTLRLSTPGAAWDHCLAKHWVMFSISWNTSALQGPGVSRLHFSGSHNNSCRHENTPSFLFCCLLQKV